MSTKLTPKYTAKMVLPKGGAQSWTNIMQGQADPPVPNDLDTGSPIVMACAIYEDGTWVAGGVSKGENPTEYNNKFMWVFDEKGNQYPGWPIDVSDQEDFSTGEGTFSLTNSEGDTNMYLLKIVEAES